MQPLLSTSGDGNIPDFKGQINSEPLSGHQLLLQDSLGQKCDNTLYWTCGSPTRDVSHCFASSVWGKILLLHHPLGKKQISKSPSIESSEAGGNIQSRLRETNMWPWRRHFFRVSKRGKKLSNLSPKDNAEELPCYAHLGMKCTEYEITEIAFIILISFPAFYKVILSFTRSLFISYILFCHSFFILWKTVCVTVDRWRVARLSYTPTQRCVSVQ